jgi:hypothetical protein
VAMMGLEMRQRLFALAGVGAVVVVVRFSRLLQVGAFAAAAGVRKLLGTSVDSRPGMHAQEWDRQAPPHQRPISGPSRVAITHHPWYQHHRASDACTCMAEAAALGVGYLRSDVRWKDVIPDCQSPDEDAFKWYRSYFTAARDWYGLEPLFVLSEAPKAIDYLDGEGRMRAWRFYLEEVAGRLGDEPNNPVFRFFPKAQQSEAVEVASEVLKRHIPEAKILVNFLLDLPNWKRSLTQMLTDSGSAVDIVAVDHYPGTWSLSLKADWSETIEIASSIRNAVRGSIWDGRRLAIIETGYPTNLAGVRTERHQSDYFASLQVATRAVDLALGSQGLDLLGIYEICDDDSAVFLDPEAHFGILTSTFRRKASFRAIQQLCSSVDSRKAFTRTTKARTL